MPGSGGRPTGRPDQEPVDRNGRPAVHKNVHAGQPFGPVDRAVDRLKATHSRVVPVDRAVDRPESCCSLVLGAVDGRSTGRLNGQIFDHWPVDRPVDRKGKMPFSAANG